MRKRLRLLGSVLWLVWATASRCLADETLAERSAQVVHNDVMKLFDIFVTIVECLGAVLMLWSCFELGTGMQSRDAQSSLKGYKMFGASVLLLLASVIYEMLTS